jgi:hypothetical protein
MILKNMTVSFHVLTNLLIILLFEVTQSSDSTSKKCKAIRVVCRGLKEEVNRKKFSGLIGSRPRDLLACSMVPQSTTLPRAVTI